MITEKDRAMAQRCIECGLCQKMRVNPKGFVFRLINKIKGSLCPYCKAYEKVYGHKVRESVSP